MEAKAKSTSQLISQIAKAKRYAEEPERIQFKKFEATLRGNSDVHTLAYDNGKWQCTCRFFHDAGDCPHIIAMQRILGCTLPQTQQPSSLLEKSQQETKPEPFFAPNIQSIRIRITEQPLTTHNLATILSALTELYTKCWLRHLAV